MNPDRERRLAGPVRLAFAAALAAYLSVAAWLVWRTAILEPYSDMFDWIARHDRFQADGDLGRYLWTPHNFHHLVWTFAILDLDIRVFGASSYLFLAVGVLCLAATAAMLAWVGGAAAGRGLRLVGAGGAATLSLMGCHILDASADINTTYVHALVFAVAAILLAEAPGEPTAARRAGALLCAVAAGLGSAAGLAVWPALLLGAWRGGNRRWRLAVLVAGAAFGLIYAMGQSAPVNPAAGAADPARLVSAISLFLNFLGLPWGRGLPTGGWVAGLGVLALSLAAVIFRGRRDAPWPQRAAVQLILFSLTTAALAAVGRTGVFPSQSVPLRYAVFLAPLHVGLWTLALPYLRSVRATRPALAGGLVVAAAVLMLCNQAALAVYAIGSADAHRHAIADFRAGKRNPAMLTAIYPNLAKASALSERMRAEGIYQRELRPDPVRAAQRMGYLGFMD